MVEWRPQDFSRMFGLLVPFVLLCSCSDRIPSSETRVPLRFVRLEPNTRSRLAYIDWRVTTDAGEHVGRVAITGTAEALRFNFPGDERLTEIELTGYDAEGRLRAGGRVEEAALAAATAADPARLWFHLYDEFQAYVDSPKGTFQVPAVYLDSSGRAVSLGGNQGEATSAVYAFDVVTGIESQVGSLLRKRFDYGFTQLADGRFFLAGGQGDSDTFRSAEIWDPGTNQSTALPFFSEIRYYRSTVFQVGGEVWIVGGTEAPPYSAEIFNGSTFELSTPRFETSLGANYFWKHNEVAIEILEIRAWKGNQETTGRYYQSNLTDSFDSFDQTATFHNGIVLAVNDKVLLWGAENVSYQCNRVALLPKSGDLAGGSVRMVSHPVCQPGIVLLDADKALVAGGNDGTTGFSRKVKHYEISANTIIQPTTPDGRDVELVYGRNRPNILRRGDGVIIVAGGTGTELTPRYEVLVPTP